jgi:hypothetical protein
VKYETFSNGKKLGHFSELRYEYSLTGLGSGYF